MGEEPPLSHFAEYQPGSYPNPLSPPIPHFNGTSTHHHTEEEPYTIRCICGFADDDGNTVLCEQCETWQHIECYYYPTLKVPDVHKCVECLPRILDSVNATLRQRRLRETVNGTDDRKARKAGHRAHKRSKTKDPAPYAVLQMNGLSNADRQTHDHASASPRDQPPPSKRPKTSHRHSDSVSNNIPGHGLGHHNRTGSSTLPSASPVKRALADCPPDYYSSDFINVHQTNTDFTPAQTNLFLNIGISDLLSTWLDDPEAFAQATHGKSHADVFKQYPTPIEELETPVRKCVREDTSAVFHGRHPVWPYLAANRDLFEGQFVGELIGSIGHLHDYKTEPANNWDRLRHPDHFVFFHRHLPIYIDCRTEGTILRYARRSCRPNIRMETIITGAREYHFCFIAMCDIPEGTELTVAWDLESDPQLRDYLYRLSGSSSSLDDSQRAYLVSWVGTVLSHFGDCACPSFDGLCLMERFDRRVTPVEYPILNPDTQRKGQTSKQSPSRAIGAANSRAGSEALLLHGGGGDEEEEAGDTTSSPRSSRSRTSREPTPTSYDSTSRGGPELSERDKRKLLQQEKLFQKIELEEGQKKKKRRSGSALNTPSAATFKQPDRSYFSTSNPDTPATGIEVQPLDTETSYFTSTAQRSPIDHLSGNQSPTMRTSSRNTLINDAPKTTRPLYANASAQTEDECASTPSKASTDRRPYVPLSQRLLRRNHLHRSRMEPPTMANNLHASPSPDLPPVQSIGDVSYATHQMSLEPSSPVSTSTDLKSDEKLPLLPVRTGPGLDAPLPPSDNVTPHQNHVEQKVSPPHEPLNPPPPELPANPISNSNSASSSDHQPRNNYRVANLHVDLPPPQFRPTTDSSPLSTFGTAPLLSANVVQSPQSAGPVPPMSAPVATMSAPILTPNFTSLTQPSPIKKKMSLSDYSQRLKSKTPSTEKSQILGQPGSTSPPPTGLSPSIANNIIGDAMLPSFTGTEGGAVKREAETPQP